MDRKTTMLVAMLLVPAAVIAAEAPDFTTIDQNKDGQVSREEARTAPDILGVFSRVDVNQDDRLSAAEYQEAVKALEG